MGQQIIDVLNRVLDILEIIATNGISPVQAQQILDLANSVADRASEIAGTPPNPPSTGATLSRRK